MLVMWSERHKYPPRPVVITSASAIDSSNKCLEGRVRACIWWRADGFGMSFIAKGGGGGCCVDGGAGPKADHGFQSAAEVWTVKLVYLFKANLL